jgi:radical SAM protein with 4Fe4S-binding SPASM domain
MSADPAPGPLSRMAGWFVEPVKVQDPGGSALPEGTMLHALREIDGRVHRYHLRIERDGHSLLVVDAAAAVRLPPTVTRFATETIQWAASDHVGALLNFEFRQLPNHEIEAYEAFVRLWQKPEQATSRYPISNLVASEGMGIRGRFAAPLEADVPLPSPEQLAPLVEGLWRVGIPHVTFSAPPGFAPEHLVRAVERAEDTGMIAGVRAIASELAAGTLLDDLAQAGVDHVNVLFASRDAAIHDALLGAGDHAAALAIWDRLSALEVCPVAEIPLVEATVAGLGDTLALVAERAVSQVECFAVAAPGDMPDEDGSGALAARALPQVAATLEHLSETHDLALVWAPPVRRDPRLTLAAQVLAGPRCAGDVAVRVEPDGSVLPPRGPSGSAGNLLADPWEAIWSNPAFETIREQLAVPARCEICTGLAVCATGCPRDSAGWTWEVEG